MKRYAVHMNLLWAIFSYSFPIKKNKINQIETIRMVLESEKEKKEIGCVVVDLNNNNNKTKRKNYGGRGWLMCVLIVNVCMRMSLLLRERKKWPLIVKVVNIWMFVR